MILTFFKRVYVHYKYRRTIQLSCQLTSRRAHSWPIQSDWQFATGEDLSFRPCKKLLAAKHNHDVNDKTLHQDVMIIPSGPYHSSNIGILLFLNIIHGARKRIWISTPYFVPDEILQKGLELAVLKGVEVKILMPEHSKKKIVHWVSLSFGEQLQNLGVQVYLYSKGFIHQKVILVDEDMVLIGTCNFDNRAIHLNCELMLSVIGKEFNRMTEDMLDEDFAHASPLKGENNYYIRKFKRFRENGARLLSPLL